MAERLRFYQPAELKFQVRAVFTCQQAVLSVPDQFRYTANRSGYYGHSRSHRLDQCQWHPFIQRRIDEDIGSGVDVSHLLEIMGAGLKYPLGVAKSTARHGQQTQTHALVDELTQAGLDQRRSFDAIFTTTDEEDDSFI